MFFNCILRSWRDVLLDSVRIFCFVDWAGSYDYTDARRTWSADARTWMGRTGYHHHYRLRLKTPGRRQFVHAYLPLFHRPNGIQPFHASSVGRFQNRRTRGHQRPKTSRCYGHRCLFGNCIFTVGVVAFRLQNRCCFRVYRLCRYSLGIFQPIGLVDSLSCWYGLSCPWIYRYRFCIFSGNDVYAASIPVVAFASRWIRTID